MKKFTAIIISLAMMFALCSCNENGVEAPQTRPHYNETVEQTTVEETEASEEETEATVEETEEIDEDDFDFEEYPDGIGADSGVPYPGREDIDGVVHAEIARCANCNSDKIFVYPVLELESDDADLINGSVEAILDVVTNDEDDLYLSSDFFYYIYEDCISLVFAVHGNYDMDSFQIWNLDMETGEVVSNSDILAMSNATESSIAEAGTVACTNYINHAADWGEGYEPLIVDGALNPNSPMYDDYMLRLYDETFSIYNIHDGMSVGIDSEGTLFFTSDVMSFGGADFYMRLYNYDGISLANMYSLS